jgi:hypothetical protein
MQRSNRQATSRRNRGERSKASGADRARLDFLLQCVEGAIAAALPKTKGQAVPLVLSRFCFDRKTLCCNLTISTVSLSVSPTSSRTSVCALADPPTSSLLARRNPEARSAQRPAPQRPTQPTRKPERGAARVYALAKRRRAGNMYTQFISGITHTSVVMLHTQCGQQQQAHAMVPMVPAAHTTTLPPPQPQSQRTDRPPPPPPLPPPHCAVTTLSTRSALARLHVHVSLNGGRQRPECPPRRYRPTAASRPRRRGRHGRGG